MISIRRRKRHAYCLQDIVKSRPHLRTQPGSMKADVTWDDRVLPTLRLSVVFIQMKTPYRVSILVRFIKRGSRPA